MDGFLRRLLTVASALFLLVFVGYQAYQMLYTSIKTETVYSYSVYETVEAQGITVRSETMVPTSASGYMFYTVKDGDRVAKDGEIAQVFPTKLDATIQRQIDDLELEIATLGDIQFQGSANRVNLDVINTQIDRAVGDLVAQAHANAFSDIQALRAELLSLLNKRQVTIGKVTDFNERISALKAKKDGLAASYKKATGAVRSPVAGYFVSDVDGYENRLDYAKAASWTTEQIAKAIADPAKTSGQAYAGKVVGDYEWYFACVLDTAKAGQLHTDRDMEIEFPFLANEAVPMRVVATNRDDAGQTAVVFRCNYMSEELADIRLETGQIRLVEHTGLRIPADALTFNDKKEPGVFVRAGNTVAFRRVEILYSEPDFHVCAEKNESGYLRLYDDVVVGRKKGLYDGKVVQ